ncbi:MAG TPA: bifunctional DNA-formamidopyrimidine glycosylase/DNA-(apurinic or apyrimidinic site) lyase [Candidatus Riflebacteria bacterium]|nr:bifunctional DNA-formamidopyrimidine glycosylase/DNA-(apurinic or apyrimidinic site) lyase [Candidatus Riflebacteria bacterium]
MPELPEVNTLAVALTRQLRGDSITEWHRLSPKLRLPIPGSKEARAIIGGKIVGIKRVAKNLYFDFAGELFLKAHLGMTGHFHLTPEPLKELKHAHLRLKLQSGRILTFCDPRRFGSIEITAFPDECVTEPFAGILTPQYLATVCAKKQCSIKALIMDQQIIAGLGNIYAAEALFAAGVRPDRAAASLSRTELKKLCQAIIAVIDKAVKDGIASLTDHPVINGDTTHFEITTLIYGQQGGLCSKCRKGTVEMIRIGGRSSCYCPLCQK